MELDFNTDDKCRTHLLSRKYSLPAQLRRFNSVSLIRLILKATTIMSGRWLGRDDCPIVAEDIARARSTLLSVRAKVDSKGHDKVYAYGQALLYVARLISNTFDVSAGSALAARDMTAEDLDRVYRDLFSSTRRCRSFRAEGHSGAEVADNLATACSILKNLYRMRFHSQRASGSQMTEADDLADRLMTLVQALSELGDEAFYRNDVVPMRMAA